MSKNSKHAEHLREFQQTGDELIAAAVKAGRIPAERATDYRRMFNAAPLETHRLLTAGRSASVPASAPAPAPSGAEYPAGWLPEVGQRAATGRVIEAGD